MSPASLTSCGNIGRRVAFLTREKPSTGVDGEARGRVLALKLQSSFTLASNEALTEKSIHMAVFCRSVKNGANGRMTTTGNAVAISRPYALALHGA
jgi:hypothetical protein